MSDCTPELRLFGNPAQVYRVDIKSRTRDIKPNNLINPNEDGMNFPTAEEYIIDIILSKTMSISSVALNALSNVNNFVIQLHNTHGYYLEIKSSIDQKIVNVSETAQTNLLRIIILGTDDGDVPSRVSIKIVNIGFKLMNMKSFLHLKILGCLHSDELTKDYEKSI